MADSNNSWRPSAMVESETQGEAPSGFSSIRLIGQRISLDILEPIKIQSTDDWKLLISELDEWGETPGDVNFEILSISDNERGLSIYIKSNKINWKAQFLPWGSDGRIQSRSQNAHSDMDVPLGGYTWKGRDIIIMRKSFNYIGKLGEQLTEYLISNNAEKTKSILFSTGEILGEYHSSVESSRVTPVDQKRWNNRFMKLEEILKSNTIWRAPFTRDTPCILSLGDVRFNDFYIKNDGSLCLCINPPRLADGLSKAKCEFPAIRDFACLIHDLSRLHHSTKSSIDITILRDSLIKGWIEKAPKKWCSYNAFYAHRGGLVIWEYEQSLMDVLEAFANQSGPPEPAVSIISRVIPFQRKMYNNRLPAAISFVSFFLGVSSIYNATPTNFSELFLPSLCVIIGFGGLYFYRKASPLPSKPITHL